MNARRLAAAFLAVFALTACAVEPATPSDEPAHQVDIDALGDPTGTPAVDCETHDATQHARYADCPSDVHTHMPEGHHS